MEQLSEEALLHSPTPGSNSIAVMVKHLSGNMLSRWTDFLTTDGEKDWRERDQEFSGKLNNRADVLSTWNSGWDCLFAAILPLRQEDLDTTVYIRNMGHTVTEAINRQLCHYAYHVGQMIYLGKMLLGDRWQTLSIGAGKSKEYNADKFGKPKIKKHFTDDL